MSGAGQAHQQQPQAAGGQAHVVSSGGGSSSTSSTPPILEGSSSTYHAWSRSYVEMYTIAHEWSIDNFVELDEETMVTFKVAVESERPSAAGTGGCEELRFKLSMKPRYGENRDYISLYVHNLNRRDLKYSLNFALLSADHERRQARRADTRVHAPNESWGFPKFCQRSEVVDKASQMLPDGTLTVLCEIGGFKRITNRSDYQRVRDTFDSDSLPGLNADLKAASSDMAHADVAIVCADGQRLPCHRFILGARSDVFRAMFSHEKMKESLEGEVVVEDASPAVVKQFLRFVYTDSLDDTSFRTVSQLLPLAEKYNVVRLSVECGKLLLQSLCVENASEIAVLGQVFGVPLLQKKAIEYISQYPERVMKTDGWKVLLKQAPDVCTAIISRLSRVGSEKDVVVKSVTRT